MKLLPWEYLFQPFNSLNFHGPLLPDVGRVARPAGRPVVLYNVRTRALHRHPPYLDLYEWLLWTGVISFGLLLVESLFVFDFLFVVLTILVMGSACSSGSGSSTSRRSSPRTSTSSPASATSRR